MSKVDTLKDLQSLGNGNLKYPVNSFILTEKSGGNPPTMFTLTETPITIIPTILSSDMSHSLVDILIMLSTGQNPLGDEVSVRYIPANGGKITPISDAFPFKHSIAYVDTQIPMSSARRTVHQYLKFGMWLTYSDTNEECMDRNVNIPNQVIPDVLKRMKYTSSVMFKANESNTDKVTSISLIETKEMEMQGVQIVVKGTKEELDDRAWKVIQVLHAISTVGYKNPADYIVLKDVTLGLNPDASAMLLYGIAKLAVLIKKPIIVCTSSFGDMSIYEEYTATRSQYEPEKDQKRQLSKTA